MVESPPIRRRRWLHVGLGTMFVAGLVWLTWEVCLSSYDWRGIGRRLDSRVASGASTFDFAAETSFEWDRLFVFGSYPNRDKIEKALGTNWSAFRHTSIDSSDSVALVVFVKDGKVVYWYEQPSTIDLGLLDNETGYSRSMTKFQIDRTDWVRLQSITTPETELPVQ